jgi:hypothetical protein
VVYSRGHLSWFQPDEVHLTLEGARQFGAFLRRSLARAIARAGAGALAPAGASADHDVRRSRRTGRL